MPIIANSIIEHIELFGFKPSSLPKLDCQTYLLHTGHVGNFHSKTKFSCTVLILRGY